MQDCSIITIILHTFSPPLLCIDISVVVPTDTTSETWQEENLPNALDSVAFKGYLMIAQYRTEIEHTAHVRSMPA